VHVENTHTDTEEKIQIDYVCAFAAGNDYLLFFFVSSDENNVERKHT